MKGYTRRPLVCLTVLAVVLVGALPVSPGAGAARATVPGTATLARPCGTAQGRPRVDQVLLIWEENHSFASIIGNAAAPVLNGLASKCGLATDYYALDHPSLPNYMEMTSGLSYAQAPWSDDCDPVAPCTSAAASVFSELATAGRQWRSYAESMGPNCDLESHGDYAARHNPAVYYTSVRAQCRLWDQDMGVPQAGAFHDALSSANRVAFMTATPDLDDDMHNGTVGQADHWLATWLPQIVSSPSYRAGHLAVLIVWDEGSGSGDEPSHVPLIVMSASTPAGRRTAIPLNDYSVLRAVCQLTGVPALALAAQGRSFVGAFNL